MKPEAFLPYAGSVEWYAAWIARNRGMDITLPAERANRCLVRGNDGKPVVLTVSVEGGGHNLASRLRRGDVPLSYHGDWVRMHRGAWNAAYGRTPYYDHIAPQLDSIYESHLHSLGQLNGAIHQTALAMLAPGNLPHDAEELREIALERRPADDVKKLSIYHLLFHKGPEAIFSVLYPLYTIGNNIDG